MKIHNGLKKEYAGFQKLFAFIWKKNYHKYFQNYRVYNTLHLGVNIYLGIVKFCLVTSHEPSHLRKVNNLVSSVSATDHF
ncbi:hypothetical protein I79_001112 [Cricetulus griseus]|uniref:Uncharacterized protein n=1 Tax=Cricetulus griseus TaxID=10029 RepID=G3GTX2_CRIGR|nr:hypothetical protein I79_001112 [Cricetulus griseus]